MKSAQRFRFGVFEADLPSGELRRQGMKVRLPGQPFDVLSMLLQRPGAVVTREELRERLWAADVFVDFDQSLNKAVNRVREALGDDADNPRFIETLPRRGYRFIAPVEALDSAPLPSAPTALAEPTPPLTPPGAPVARRRWLVPLLIACGLAAAGYAAWVGLGRRTPTRGAKIMLAVLPFSNLAGDPEQDYFSDGLTEEMIAQLGSLQPDRLGVIARTSAMQYKQSRKGAGQIARELGVGYILEGSVRRSEGRVRITAQLVQTSDETHLWAESYERPAADVLAIQAEVAHRIASSLALELLPARHAALSHPATTSHAAHDAYLKGRYHWNKRTAEGLRKSLDYFGQAVDADPSYALGYAGLADAYNVLADYALLPPLEAVPKAQAAARKALELDGGLAEAHAAIAYSKWNFEWDWAGAEKEMVRAIELNPAYATARQWYAMYLGQSRRFPEALDQVQRALELDPFSLIIHTNAAALHHFSGHNDRALEECRRTLELDPGFAVGLWVMGLAYEADGRYPEAIAALDKAIAASSGSPTFVAARAHALAASGNTEAARKVLETLLAERRKSYVSPFDIALLHAGLGERDRAFEWLEVAHNQRSNALTDLRVDPRLEPLRSDPRFAALVKRVGIP